MFLKKSHLNMSILLVILSVVFFSLSSATVFAKIRNCGPFFLRTATGEIINPLRGENSSEPFSTRQTCGACHSYDSITKGFHFQQGWESISDTFSDEQPWVLSDGMMGKH